MFQVVVDKSENSLGGEDPQDAEEALIAALLRRRREDTPVSPIYSV